MTEQPNTRPCGSCRHLDSRNKEGVQFCWRYYVWRDPDKVVPDCTSAERANGEEPPGRIHFGGERA